MTRLQAEAEASLTALRPFKAVQLLRTGALGQPAFEAHSARRQARRYASELEPAVGRAWFPVEARQGVGLVRVEVHVGEGPSGLPRPESALVAGALAAGQADAQLHVRVWPEPPPITGRSYELATALAAWSRLTGTVLPHLCATGHIDGDAVVPPPAASLAAKLDATSAAPTMFLLTGSGAPEPWQSAPTLAAVLQRLGLVAEGPPPLRELLTAAHAAADRRDDAAAEERARRALERGQDLLQPSELFALARLRAQALNHLGRSAEVIELYDRAQQWAAPAARHERVSFVAVLGVALLDQDQPEFALQRLEATAADLEAAPRPGPHDFALTQVRGTQARCASAAGRHELARDLGLCALALSPPLERARNRVDCACWALRASDAETALEILARADEDLALPLRESPAAAEFTRNYLLLCRARALLLLGRDEDARALSIEAKDQALELGGMELRAQLGDDPIEALASFDGRYTLPTGSVLARYRARVELQRPSPDLGLVGRLTGSTDAPHIQLARLAERLPY